MDGQHPFRAHLIGLGYNPKTISLYARRVEAAEIWFSTRGLDLISAGGVDIALWVDELAYSSGVRHQTRSALKLYYQMHERRDPPLTAIRVPAKPQYYCRALDEGPARVLQDAAIGWHPEGTVVLAGLYLALRAQEIASMRWDRFTADLSWYTVLGKGSRTNTIPVHERFQQQIRGLETAYVYLFPGSRSRAHIGSATVWTWVKEVAKEAGVGDVKTHQLRHTALATANDRLGDLRAVAEFARHMHVDQTRIYTRTTAKRLQEVVASLEY